MLKAIAASSRFAVEIAALAGYAYAGFHVGGPSALRLALAVGAPVAAALAGGVLVAPAAKKRLRDPGRFLVEHLLLGAAATALVLVGRPARGLALAVAIVASTGLLVASRARE